MLSQTEKEELKKEFGDKVSFDEALSFHTSMRIGGPADVIAYPADVSDLEKLLLWCRQRELPHFVLGKGSNTLVRDGGFRGMVLSLSRGFQDYRLARENGKVVWVMAGAGCPTQALVRWATTQGFGGLECLAGVPGAIGGNVVMNAGTFYGEIKDLIESVEILDAAGRVRAVPREKIDFEYRKTNLPPKAIVLGTMLKLEKANPEELDKKVRGLYEKRGDAQPVNQPSLGSIFKNPPKKKAKELIDDAGLRGVRVGGARISDKHPNWILNEKNATAKDVLILIDLIKDRVKESSGILLETEIKVIGDDKI